MKIYYVLNSIRNKYISFQLFNPHENAFRSWICVLQTLEKLFLHCFHNKGLLLIYKNDAPIRLSHDRWMPLVNICVCMSISKQMHTYVHININTIHKEERMWENKNGRNKTTNRNELMFWIFLTFSFSLICSSLWIVFMLLFTYVYVCFEICTLHIHM